MSRSSPGVPGSARFIDLRRRRRAAGGWGAGWWCWRRNLDAALQNADDNDEHFYSAELLRIRAHTHVDPDRQTAGFAAAAELARRPGAALFELRATLDDFELRGEPARAALVAAVSRMPTDGAMPEVALARAALDQADATRS
jgi:hypothetical protein